VQLIAPELEDIDLPVIDAPVAGNYSESDPDVTAVLVQVDPQGAYDGQFVAF
jgi:hypothetical protein